MNISPLFAMLWTGFPLGTERLLQRQSNGVLTVSTSPDFAAKWLVNRLGLFGEAHPGIDLRVSATIAVR